MSKICDCEGADRAYVIINPDSPDRKEVLSLNPPICRDQVQEAEEIRVDWGNGDIDILLGSTWKLEYQQWIYFFRGISSTKYALNRSAWSSSPSFVLGGYGFSRDFVPLYEAFGYSSSPLTPPPSQRDNANFMPSAFFDGRRIYSYACSNPELGSFGLYAIRDPNAISSNLLASGISCRVVTDLADTSYRDRDTPPDVSFAGGEFLVITDNGGELFRIPLNNQQIDVQCGDRQCPPETCCNPCEGSALNCCYDENGKLIDSFIRRS